MDKSRFTIDFFLLNESFQRYVLQDTLEDRMFWEQWIKENPEEFDSMEKARESILFLASRKRKPHHPGPKAEVFERLQKQINQQQKRKVIFIPEMNKRLLPYAAAIVLLVSLVIIFPRIIRKDGFQASGKFLEVIVPKGQKSQLILPDGTKVWLNAGTTLKYPVDFNPSRRKVFLEGEAFFDVQHQEGHPFLVMLKNNLVVKVTGTEFNVKSYPDDQLIETTLLEGSVILQSQDKNKRIVREIRLKPNEKATFIKKDHKILLTQVEKEPQPSIPQNKTSPLVPVQRKKVESIEQITSWRNEELIFQDKSFEEIAIMMERWYGYKITIVDDSLKKVRFTGKFVNKETIYQVLDIINRTEPIEYTMKNKELTIRKPTNSKH